MAEGRSYEQIDEMTLFDLELLGKHRADSPSVEDMVRLIAQWAGAYKPRSRLPDEVEADMPISSLHDPRAEIREMMSRVRAMPADFGAQVGF